MVAAANGDYFKACGLQTSHEFAAVHPHRNACGNEIVYTILHNDLAKFIGFLNSFEMPVSAPDAVDRHSK